MKKTLNFTFKGAVPSKKNSYRIGNSKWGRRKLFKPQELTDFDDLFYYQFHEQYKGHKTILAKQITMFIHFCLHTDRDLDNMITTVMDAMQFAGVVKNDKYINAIHATKKKLGPKEQAHVDISLHYSVAVVQ